MGEGYVFLVPLTFWFPGWDKSGQAAHVPQGPPGVVTVAKEYNCQETHLDQSHSQGLDG